MGVNPLWRVALKTWRRLAMPTVLFIAAAACLLGTAAVEGCTLSRERSAPCRLIASVPDGFGADVSALSQIEGVEACTLVYELDGTLTVRGYAAECTLAGVDGSFLEGELEEGVLYGEDTAMPYLVLNEAALKLFQEESGEDAAVDWRNDPVTLTLGASGVRVAARISGILSGGSGTGQPAVYVGPSAARSLLLQSGETGGARIVWVDLQNSGIRADAAEGLEALGLTAENGDRETDWRWTLEQARIRWLCLAGGIALLAALAVLHGKLRLDQALHQPEYDHLQALGPARGDVRKTINRVRIAVTVACGLALGAAAGLIGRLLFGLS